MTQPMHTDELPGADTPTDDTPVDERPPYGDPGAGFHRFVTVAAIIAATMLALYVAFRVWRSVWRHAATVIAGAATVATVDPAVTVDQEVIIIPDSRPAAGPVWKVHFYDDNYRQLVDRDISVVLYLDDPDADRHLASLALNLAAEVERRDGQRCFAPRVVLVDGRGRTVREWSGGVHR